ncbi:unnamed protein product [Euphydryas editha]|uniref:Uncharacterized protein n=1 Tax=Euphydryas editha TaxID=104508 RepID=A0AAU9TM65_EUPED|nr:unnamed protein product [Euphydryas editha]
MIDGYTYSKKNKSKVYYCSKKKSGLMIRKDCRKCMISDELYKRGRDETAVMCQLSMVMVIYLASLVGKA